MSKLVPLGRKILIKPDPKPAEVKSEGGIVLVEGDHGPPELAYGQVEAVGPGAYGAGEWDGSLGFKDHDNFIAPDPSLVGQRVCYRYMQSHAVEAEGVRYDICDMDAVIALAPL